MWILEGECKPPGRTEAGRPCCTMVFHLSQIISSKLKCDFVFAVLNNHPIVSSLWLENEKLILPLCVSGYVVRSREWLVRKILQVLFTGYFHWEKHSPSQEIGWWLKSGLGSRVEDKWASPWHLSLINLWYHTGILKNQKKKCPQGLLSLRR